MSEPKELVCPRKVVKMVGQFNKTGIHEYPCIHERCAFWMADFVVHNPAGQVVMEGACSDRVQAQALMELVKIFVGLRMASGTPPGASKPGLYIPGMQAH